MPFQKLRLFFTDFNTKFVIAKYFPDPKPASSLVFQYKICYSKINEVKDDFDDRNIFQYKICYSKI